MLSRLSVCGAQNFARCLVVKHQPSSCVTTSSSSAQTPAESSKRDLINFPRRVRPEYSPPTRFGFVPDSWFQFFYPKTGVTGPYMFIMAFGTYLFSKEIIVLDHNFYHGLSLVTLLYYIQNKYGNQIGEFYNKTVQNEIDSIDGKQKAEKEDIKEALVELEKQTKSKEIAIEVMKALRENVYFQMESVYRERLQEAYKIVKRRLDCQVELQNAERRIAQKNLFDYVIRNVMSSITPEQEKNAMQSCISDLNALASKY